MGTTTIYDVAKAARVSPATVSRVLSGRPPVSTTLKNRVLRATEELGYTPNRVARSLRRKDSSLLALIISDIENPFFTSLVRGVDDLARGFGLSVVLFNTDEDLAKEKHHLAVAAAERMAGVIFSPISENESDVKALLNHGQPVVTIDRRLRTAEVDSVTVTNVKGAKDATMHLVDEGFERVACVIGPLYTSTYRDRIRGYRQALQQRGIPFDPDLVVQGGLEESGGYEATRHLLSLDDPPHALFVTNSLLAVGALEYLSEVGVLPGPDLGFVTFDDMAWTRLVSPTITVVSQPTYKEGERAVALLTKRMSSPGAKVQSVVLDTELKVRESSVRRSRLSPARGVNVRS
jgi:LacI family transcriptional regulator